MSRLFSAASLALLVLAVAPRAAHAFNRPLVLITVDASCTAIDAREIRHLMAIELAADLDAERPIDIDPPIRPVKRFAATRVGMWCRDTEVSILVDDPLTAKRVERVLHFDETPVASRTRMLALGASELVLASWSELIFFGKNGRNNSGMSAADRKSARDAVTQTLERAADVPAHRLRVAVAIVEQSFIGGAGTFWGAGTEVGRDEGRALGWLVDGQVTHGQIRVPSGSVDMELLSVGAALWLHGNWRRVALRGGVGLRGGAVRFAGKSSDLRTSAGASFWGGWLAGTGGVALDVSLSRRLGLLFGVELGYVALRSTARGWGEKVVAIDGPFAGCQLGLTVLP